MWELESEFLKKIDDLQLDALICFRLALKYDDNYIEMLKPKFHRNNDNSNHHEDFVSPF